MISRNTLPIRNDVLMHADSLPDSDASQPGIKGQWVIAGMFGFAIVMTSILFIYWEYHTAKFRPFQDAIAAEFPKSRPRVEGGRHKSQRATPRILRVVMKVDFNQQDDKAAAEAIVDRVATIADRTGYLSSTDYDLFEVHLFWPEPEKEILQLEITRSISEALPEAG